MTNRETLTEHALQYVSYLEAQDALLQAPARTKHEILEKSKRLDVQLIAHTNAAAKKLEFFMYTLRVGFAVTFALFMLIELSFSTPEFLQPELPIANTLQYKTHQLNTYLNNLSQSIFVFETEDTIK